MNNIKQYLELEESSDMNLEPYIIVKTGYHDAKVSVSCPMSSEYDYSKVDTHLTASKKDGIILE